MAPFILIGAGGTTYDIDRYKTAKEAFKSHNNEYESALAENDRARAANIKEKYPDLVKRKRIEALFDKAKETELLIKRREKKGLQVPQILRDRLEKQKADALEAFRAAR
jgi:guanylate kinase